MSQQSPLTKAYLFIKKNRLHSKKRLYKMAFGVMIDKTIAIYLLVLFGYFIASFFIMGEFITDFSAYFIDIEAYMIKYIWLISTVIPIRSVFQSFSKPGVIYSTSEHQLSLLPYSRDRIWFMTVLEKWLKSITLYLLLGLIILLFTPISKSLIFTIVLFIILTEVIMTLPQWVLYQKSFFQKTAWLLLLLFINFINVTLELWWFGAIFIFILVLVNFSLRQRTFNQVNWSKVTEISDFTIWNMPLIAKASDVKFKKQKKYSLFENFNYRKKPFKYKEESIHRRMWSLYLAKSTILIVQFIGASLVLLVVLMFTKPLLFQIGIAFSLHAYTAILASFFTNRFEVDVVSILPWDLLSYKKSFLKWANYGGLMLLIPILVELIMNATLWLPFQLLFYLGVYYFLYDIKINRAMRILARKNTQTDLLDTLSYVLLLGVILTVIYPFLSLSFIVIIWLEKRVKTMKV